MNALGTRRLAGVHVLVVDDDEDMRFVTHVTLRSQGAIVTEAASAREALDVLRQERPDVLVSDLSMPPGEDGYWLIGAVRALSTADGGGTPAAAVTATSRPRTAPGCCAPGSSTTSPSPWIPSG
jgi:CheY-like chemotaxis protein